jgi:O-acetyl-ADP-ribose deacetylase (regulator of RNase III)
MNEVDKLLRILGDGAQATPEQSRRRLREIITVLPPGEIPEEAWPLLEALWSAEAAMRVTTRASALPRLSKTGWGSHVSVWHGDITKLEIDAIVNAANSGLTGCYSPMHPCVDNAIHTAAGPWLREECGRIMKERGRPEPTSTATVTRGYFLPARHVIHTVGPIVERGAPTAGDEAALSRCYSGCLGEAAATPGVTSIAFCGISTGVFGYTPALAAPVATNAVRGFLESDGRIEHCVLVAYSQSDFDVLTAAATDELNVR